MFKLIAIRSLRGCADYIKKCLADDCLYYLSNEYTIRETDNKGLLVDYRNKYAKPLHEDFFRINQNVGSPKVNISAIVGMNGDGKSSLVELMIRTIHNFMVFSEVDGIESYAIRGVCAELFYQVDDSFYRLNVKTKLKDETLAENENPITAVLEKIAIVRNGEIENISPVRITDINDWTEHFFYTYVSNYAHYAYNIYDFEREWNPEEFSRDDNDKCWLFKIFHKNDGYNSPLNINPYRYNGDINMRREKVLTHQRLESLFIDIEDENDETFFRNVNGKKAIALVLTDIGYSKLRENIIYQYFEEKRNDNILTKYTEDNFYTALSENVETQPLDELFGILDSIYRHWIEPYKDDLHKILSERVNRKSLTGDSGDINTLFVTIGRLSDLRDSQKQKFVGLENLFSECRYFSLSQLQRLGLVHTVIDLWKDYYKDLDDKAENILANADFIFKDYGKMNFREMCLHYIVYKTIAIFDTYKQYKGLNELYQKAMIDKSDVEYAQRKVKSAFTALETDFADEQSHQTQKLRHAMTYLEQYRNKDEKAGPMRKSPWMSQAYA